MEPEPNNRRARRNTAAALAREIMAHGSPRKRSLDVALWFVAAFLALALMLIAPKLGRGVTVVILALMVACTIHPVLQLPWVVTRTGTVKLEVSSLQC